MKQVVQDFKSFTKMNENRENKSRRTSKKLNESNYSVNDYNKAKSYQGDYDVTVSSDFDDSWGNVEYPINMKGKKWYFIEVSGYLEYDRSDIEGTVIDEYLETVELRVSHRDNDMTLSVDGRDYDIDMDEWSQYDARSIDEHFDTCIMLAGLK